MFITFSTNKPLNEEYINKMFCLNKFNLLLMKRLNSEHNY
jgi:hypothetical protein